MTPPLFGGHGGSPPGHSPPGHEPDHESLSDQIKRIRDMLLGRIPSLLTQMDAKLDALKTVTDATYEKTVFIEADLDTVETDLDTIQAQCEAIQQTVDEILDNVGEPEELEVLHFLSAPVPK